MSKVKKVPKQQQDKKKTAAKKTTASKKTAAPKKVGIVTIGDVVTLKKGTGYSGTTGTVKFVGQIVVNKKKGVYYGIEMDGKGSGKSNGKIGKDQHFKCGKQKGTFVTKDKIVSIKTKSKSIRVGYGSKVKVNKIGIDGVIRYIGEPGFAKGVWYGAELPQAKGKNDGSVKDRVYFTCRKEHGTFQKAENLEVIGTKKKKIDKNEQESKDDDKENKNDENDENEADKENQNEENKPKIEDKVSSAKADVSYEVGDKIEVKPGKLGQIVWSGKDIKGWGPGQWFGVRLTEKRGDTDGEFKDKRFFKCEKNFGLYVQRKLIVRKLNEEEGKDINFMEEEKKIDQQEAAEEASKAAEIKAEKDKIEKLKNQFKEIDTDGSKTLDLQEFTKLCKDALDVNDTTAKELFSEVDVSGNKQISFAEFESWVDKIGGIDKLEDKDETCQENEKDAKAVDPPKEENKKDDVEEPKDASKDAPKEDAPKEDAPKEDASKEDDPKEEAPKEEAPKDEAKEEVPKEEACDNNEEQAKNDPPKEEEVVKGEEDIAQPIENENEKDEPE